MKFGVFAGPIYPGEMDPAEAFELALAIARTSHESGFDGIFAAHHYSTGPSHTMFHPLLLLSRLSAECPERYLGTSVYLLPYTHPVIAAEATAFLDVRRKAPLRRRPWLPRGRTGKPSHPARL
jgi:alkanesulfonate monooxygenase SsuD/methylene tetrahydromethanopterin reductase-like flavin-dependent oxidoreductase (luciferase family)